MNNIKVKNVSDIPAEWPVFTVKKTSSVQIRISEGVERFKVSWQDAELVSDPELDLIVVQPNGKEYPCKKDIFFDTYEPVTVSSVEDVVAGYKFIKKATSQIVEIPEGFSVEIETLEGVLPAVTFPDYIAIGAKGELYANTREFVQNNMKIL